MDPAATDLSAELARQMRLLNGTVVQPEDFDFSALPTHLRVTFRVMDGKTELGRGKDLRALRTELSSYVRADLTKAAREEERSGLLAWTVGELDRTITAGQVTGYPAIVDEGRSVALRVLDSAAEQTAAMMRGQAKLISFVLSAPVPQIGRSLDLHSKLLLSTGPYSDAAAVIEECWLAAIEALIPTHGGPAWDESAFDALQESIRADVYDETERAVHNVIAVLRALGEVTPDNGEAGEDVRVQLSWLIYPGFIRDTGTGQLKRLPLYLEAARRHLASPKTPADLPATQELEALFHERTDSLSVWARLAPDVQHARWALEELRLSLFAQDLRTAFPVSVKRVRALVDGL